MNTPSSTSPTNPNGFAAALGNIPPRTPQTLADLIELTAPYRPVMSIHIFSSPSPKVKPIKTSDPRCPNYPALDTPLGNIKFPRAPRRNGHPAIPTGHWTEPRYLKQHPMGWTDDLTQSIYIEHTLTKEDHKHETD